MAQMASNVDSTGAFQKESQKTMNRTPVTKACSWALQLHAKVLIILLCPGARWVWVSHVAFRSKTLKSLVAIYSNQPIEDWHFALLKRG
jgi:hypothetical protein